MRQKHQVYCFLYMQSQKKTLYLHQNMHIICTDYGFMIVREQSNKVTRKEIFVLL